MRWQIKGSKLSAHLATSVLRPMYKVWGTALAPDLPTRGRTYNRSQLVRERKEKLTWKSSSNDTRLVDGTGT